MTIKRLRQVLDRLAAVHGDEVEIGFYDRDLYLQTLDVCPKATADKVPTEAFFSPKVWGGQPVKPRAALMLRKRPMGPVKPGESPTST